MKKDYAIVIQAESDVINDITKKVYLMLGAAQRLHLIQEKLPKKPLFGVARISTILRDR